MPDLRQALIGHLNLAVDSYGGDLCPPAVDPARIVQPVMLQPAMVQPAMVQPAMLQPAGHKPQMPRPAMAPDKGATNAGTAVDPAAALAALRCEVLPCTKCRLHQGRTQVVFGEGDPCARVMFVGEAPGQVEDETGRPFVGRSGELLDKIIGGAMGMRREEVYIANINKCRPPGNRDPEPLEIASCLPWLRRQIELVAPEVIVVLGRVALWNLLGTTESMGRMRGRDLAYADIPVVATWHPAYLLRNPSAKRETWADIKRVNRLLGNPEVPERPL